MAERKRAQKAEVVKIVDGQRSRAWDRLAVEEPMEIRIDGQPVAVTMRTPGNDFELALGFCLTEGIVTDPRAVEAMRYCSGDDPETGLNTYNVVDLGLRDPSARAHEHSRSLLTNSSCGVCGSASLDAVRRALPALHDDDVSVSETLLAQLPDKLRDGQEVFDRTGGLHAAALFDAEGTRVAIREDVGRHNAVDKLVGWAATEQRLPLRGHILMVSGRVAFEIVQKAQYAGVPVIAAVSAPTSLAVELARDAGITLAGFLRDGRMNIYSGEHRLS